MKASLALLFAIVAAVSGQRGVDSRNAAILAEARYLQGDGSFGSAYVQEDGVEFKEETDANGDRKGQYSYVDPNGKKITVQYTAGKNGFQVSGDHLPRAPVPQQAPAPRAPVPQYNPAPQYNSIQHQQPQQQQQQYNQGGNNIEDGQYRPEVHEHPYQYKDGGNNNNNYNNQQYNPAPVQQHSQQPQQNNYNQAGFNFNQQQQQQYDAYHSGQQTSTQAPNRFFPPGKLDLNRTPDGYQYQFSSQGGRQ